MSEKSVTTKCMMVGLLATASLVWAQKPKSNAEAQMVNTMLQAQAPDDTIKAVDALLAKYKDTEFKALALERAGEAYEQKGDSVNAIIYGNRALEADPKNYFAMLLVARRTAQDTHENDLDKDDKIKRTNKLGNEAIAIIKAAAKPNPSLADEQWTGIKNELIAQAHSSMGVAAAADKKYDVAITEYKASLDANPDPVSMVRLANAYNRANKPDDALQMADKALASAGLPDSVKKFAEEEKRIAEKAKAGK